MQNCWLAGGGFQHAFPWRRERPAARSGQGAATVVVGGGVGEGVTCQPTHSLGGLAGWQAGRLVRWAGSSAVCRISVVWQCAASPGLPKRARTLPRTNWPRLQRSGRQRQTMRADPRRGWNRDTEDSQRRVLKLEEARGQRLKSMGAGVIWMAELEPRAVWRQSMWQTNREPGSHLI